MRAGVMGRRPVDLAALVCGIVVTGIGVVLLLDFLDVIELDFGALWPLMLAFAGAILLALGLTSPRPPR
jgi:LiaI-LiaF-like transmembrane region